MFTVPLRSVILAWLAIGASSASAVEINRTDCAWTVRQGDPIPPNQSITVSKTGSAGAAWQTVPASDPSGVFTWAPTTGNSDPASAISFGVTSAALDGGSYALDVVVHSAGDAPDRTVHLLYDVYEPPVQVSPPRLHFEVRDGAFIGPATGTLHLTEDTPGPNNCYSVATSKSWIQTNVTQGSVGGGLSLDVLVDASGAAALPAGMYDGAVVVGCIGPENSPITVPVTVLVHGSSALSVWPPRVTIERRASSVVSADVFIDEAGDEEGRWQVLSAPSWLQVVPSSGAHGARVAFRFDPASGMGTGSGTVVLASLDDGATTPVPVDVVDPGDPFVATPPSAQCLLRAGTSLSPPWQFALTTRLGGARGFGLTTTATWLTLSANRYVTPATLTVTASALGLAPGTYKANVVAFEVPPPTDGPARTLAIPVTMVVAPSTAPLAAFSPNQTIGTSPLTVAFTDQTSGTVTQWSWSFADDGSTSAVRHPSHTFVRPGVFPVTLTVTGPGGSTSISKSITVYQRPLAFAGQDRQVSMDVSADSQDAGARIVMSAARATAAPPARVASVRWDTYGHGVFEDTGTSVSHLERPVLIVRPSDLPLFGGNVTMTVVDERGAEATSNVNIQLLGSDDRDGDSVMDVLDNCPSYNNTQVDSDGDGIGDPCDACPLVSYPFNRDQDGSGDDSCQTANRLAIDLSERHAEPSLGCNVGTVRISTPTVNQYAAVRRVNVSLGADRSVSAVRAIGDAATLGGTAAYAVEANKSYVELRVPAGLYPALGPFGAPSTPVPFLEASYGVGLGDHVVAIDCDGPWLGGFGELSMPTTCDPMAGAIRVCANGDAAPRGAPDGLITAQDFILAMAAATGQVTLDDDERARLDVSPGVLAGSTWSPMPDCQITVDDANKIYQLLGGTMHLPPCP